MLESEGRSWAALRPDSVLVSGPNTPLLPPDWVVRVKTSLKREGTSFRLSAFQIPWPHGKDGVAPLPRGFEAAPGSALCGTHTPESAEGVFGWEVVGDMDAPTNEPLRVCMLICVVSFNQDARRAGF